VLALKLDLLRIQFQTVLLSSFIPGKKKKTGDSILIRGFWGDIINSPFVGFGFEVRDPKDREKFFRKLNF
jgi:hypothetical protein